MEKCHICRTRFKWSQIYRSFWFVYESIECRTCQTRHEIQFTSKVLMALLLIIPMHIYGFYLSENKPLLTVATMMMIGLVITLFLPFLVKYRSTNKQIYVVVLE